MQVEKGATMRWIMVLALTGLAGGAQAQVAGLTLPVEGQVILWDMGAMPPQALSAALPPTIAAGQCYILKANTLRLQGAANGCLEFYVYHGKLDALPTLSASGRIGFNNRVPDQAYRGLQLDGVTTITDCGERSDCDTLFITAFANKEVAAKAMAAAREGRQVTLHGREIWHLESRDIIVEDLRP